MQPISQLYCLAFFQLSPLGNDAVSHKTKALMVDFYFAYSRAALLRHDAKTQSKAKQTKQKSKNNPNPSNLPPDFQNQKPKPTNQKKPF